MYTFKILTDSACDLTKEQLAALDVDCVQLRVQIPGSDITLVSCDDEEIRPFYRRLRDGEQITTSAVNSEEMKQAMEKILAQGLDLLYLGFDSSLSSTYQNGSVAAQELQEKYPERKIYTFDTLCASLGFGLLVTLTAEKRLQGWDLEQTRQFAEETAPRLCHWFTVGDLHFLRRGGRLSAASAVVGTILHVKPILHNDSQGRLVPFSKVKGRKKAMDTLVEYVQAGAIDPKSQRMMICHGDCIEDAEYVKQQLLEKVGVPQVDIGYTGSVIGSHSGPGTLAVFYIGTNR